MEHEFKPYRIIQPFIASGEKDLEIRVADYLRSKICVSDTILFKFPKKKPYPRKVKAIRRYGSFKEMLDNENPERIMPGWLRERILQGLQRVYPPKEEQRGVLVFELEVTRQ